MTPNILPFDGDLPMIASDVCIAPNAMVIDDVLIGMGANVLDEAVVETGALITAAASHRPADTFVVASSGPAVPHARSATSPTPIARQSSRHRRTID